MTMLDISNLLFRVQSQSCSRRFRPHKHRSARRHFRHRQRAAVIRACTAARLYLIGEFPSLEAAAVGCGSNIQYVRAAVVLLEAENATLFQQVLRGDISLLAAARQARQVGKLVAAYRKASAADRVAFAKAIGPTTLFDTALVPAI
jgi:hypothetical protein